MPNYKNDYIDLYCVDCQKWTRQKYHHKNFVDGDDVYVCEMCGCENSLFPADQHEDGEGVHEL